MIAKSLSSRPARCRAAVFHAAAAALLLCASTGSAAEQACTPSLADVFARVEAGPRLAASAEETLAHRDVARQAGARPNPEVLFEVEDFTGSGPYTEFGGSQSTLAFTQKIELGGVRDRRVDSAEREGDAAGARAGGERLQALASAKQRYVEALAASESLANALDTERLARDFLAETEKRGANAAASEADIGRARVALASASLAVAGHQRDLAIAREKLAASWGGSLSDLPCSGGAARLPAPRRLHASTEAAAAPAVALAEAEVAKARADVALAQASAAPDLQVGAGLRYHAYSDVSAVAELRIEVPIFDRNEGAIAASERKLAAAQSRALAVRRETEARIARLGETLDAAEARERTIAGSMIPSAERASASLLRAWQSGAVSTFEVLDARRSVLELQQQRIDARSDYHRTLAALEAATGNVSSALGLPASPARKEN